LRIIIENIRKISLKWKGVGGDLNPAPSGDVTRKTPFSFSPKKGFVTYQKQLKEK
jgi:hypothetical protein